MILDIPLYLENKLRLKNDVIIYIDSKNKDIKSRLLKRKSFNNKLLKLFKNSASIINKKKKSDFIIKNDFTTKKAKRSVKYILTQLRHERNNT